MSRRRPIEREPISTLKSSFLEHHFSEADVVEGDYVAPDGGRGQHTVHPPGHPEIPYNVTGPRRTFAPGTRVVIGAIFGSDRRIILNDPPPGRRGGSLYGADTPAPSRIDAVKVTSADPAEWVSGSQVVTLIGYGFNEDPLDDVYLAVWNASTKDYDPDPYGEIVALAFVDETHLTATVEVSTDTPIGYRWGCRARRAE